MVGHAARVSSLAWNGTTLTSGGRDSLIINHDGIILRLAHIQRQMNPKLRYRKRRSGKFCASSRTLIFCWFADRLKWLFISNIWMGKPLEENLSTCIIEMHCVEHCEEYQRFRLRSVQCTILRVTIDVGVCVLCNHHTVRAREATSTLLGHSQEVCGLRWSFSGQQLASGGNDNLLHIWDAAATTSSTDAAVPLHRLEGHQAAVKALAWCPYQNNILASGGGTADRCIKFWNTNTGYCTNSVDTNSQVCGTPFTSDVQ